MSRVAGIVIALWCGVTLAADPLLPLGAKKQTGPKVEVQLLANKTSLVPGGATELAVAFQLEPGWHIYWRNRGEGGMEPSIKWHLPDGYDAGAFRWPAPTRHVDKADAHTFILEGRPALLTTLTVPKNAPVGTDATLVAEVTWFVCKETCHRGSKTVTLKIPIGEKDHAQPANEDVFAAAESRVPVAQDKAKYLSRLNAVASVDKVRPGDKFQVAVVLEVKEGYHFNSHNPPSEYAVPTDVIHDATEGLDIQRPIFPPGKEETGGTPDEKLSVYRGTAGVLFPIEVDGSLEGKTVRVSGVVTYQACSDKTKQCFPPAAAEWSLTIPVAAKDEKVSPAQRELFEKLMPRGAGRAEAGSGEPGSTTQPAEAGAGATSQPAMTAADAGGPTIGPPTVTVSTTFLGRLQGFLAQWGLVGYLLMALGGGFILNLMPCVLPVISIKILSFVQQAKEDRIRVFTLGAAFSAGILVSFLALGVLIAMAGQQWGGLFQRPTAVIIMTAIVTAFAMSLFGVFALQPPRLVTNLGAKAHQEGHLSAFSMGLLATALGTACTAPFLSLAIAWAVKPGQSPVIGLLIFLFAGIGMAAPYVVLAAKPGWLRIIPRPGPWMKTFESLMGFLLLGTALFLLNTINEQLGGTGLFWTVGFLLFVSLAAWLYGKAEFGLSPARRVTYYALAVACVVGGWRFCYSDDTAIGSLLAERQAERRTAARNAIVTNLDWTKAKMPWVPYSRDKALATSKDGYTTFIDYTASWCTNCKSNEKLIIDTAEVREVMRELGVVPFQADYSTLDPEIGAELARYGRSGVPMYLVIPPEQPDAAIVLDEILTSKDQVISALRKAGPSKLAGSTAAGTGVAQSG